MNELLRALEERACRSPRDVVLQGSTESVTVRALFARVELLAQELRASGARTVGLYADNSPAWALVDLACQFNDICLVPVPTFFSPGQVSHLLRTAAVDQLLFSRSLSRNLPVDILREVECLPGLPDFYLARLEPTDSPQVPPGTCKITFTSGSTGNPRGVCLAFEQCLKVAGSLLEAIEVETPKHLCVLPLSTLLENIGGLYMPLLAGGSSVILSPAELGLEGSSEVDPVRLLESVERTEPNTLILVPQLLTVLDIALANGWKAPASLQFVAVGGARVAPALLRRVRDRGLPVYEGYGLSESASVVSLNTPRYHREGSSGRVLPHVQVSSDNGELVVSGNSFLGYLGEPRSWGADSVDTGDLGAVDADGYITVAGRRKNLIITSFGRNISPEWVESELQADQLFRQVVVLGEGHPCCIALLAPLDRCLDDAEIQAAIDAANSRLPDYARVGHWLRLATPLTSADGLFTDNGRPCRGKILARYQRSIGELFNQSRESMAV